MQWLRVYINEHYADEINVVMGDDDDDAIDGASIAGSDMLASIDLAGRAMLASTDEGGALLEQNEGLATEASGWNVPRAAYNSPDGLRDRRRRTTTIAEVAEDLSPPYTDALQNSLAEDAVEDVGGEDVPPTPRARARAESSVPPSPSRALRPAPALVAPLPDALAQSDAVQQLQAQLDSLKRQSGPDPTSRQSRAELIAQARAAGSRKQVAQRNMYL